MKKLWTIRKHALEEHNAQDIADHGDSAGCIRTTIVMINLVCAFFIMANILFN